MNKVHAVGTGAETVEERPVRDGEAAEKGDEGNADRAAAQDDGEVAQQAYDEGQGPMRGDNGQDERHDDGEP
jgi:hypothetical protein